MELRNGAAPLVHIEETLRSRLKWVVFEPNGEQTWAKIRREVEGFMQELFRQGASAGSSQNEAYFVKCDGEITTQSKQGGQAWLIA